MILSFNEHSAHKSERQQEHRHHCKDIVHGATVRTHGQCPHQHAEASEEGGNEAATKLFSAIRISHPVRIERCASSTVDQK